MQTPKSFIKNLKNNIVTKEMLVLALYSVNKRAKNCRDRIRELKQSDYSYYFFNYSEMSKEKYEEKMNEYYSIKEELLSFCVPTCIHKEFKYYFKKRIYDYEKGYEKAIKNSKNIVWQNCYYEGDREVYFVDIEYPERPIYFYYLFYDFGDYSFHTPLPDFIESEKGNLEIIEIEYLMTEGKEISELYSVSFVKKVLNTLKNGGILKEE